MKELLPVVIFAFNRPQKLRRVLEALRTQSIEQMVIFIDGPRQPGDLPLVEWEENRGLNGFIDNISLVMESYRWAIFVEDDCLPMPGYCQFMRQALERYFNFPEVFSIGGYQPLAKRVFTEYPYSLISSARFNCWGWATWRDRWQKLEPQVRSYSELFNGLRDVPEIAGTDLPWVARAMANGSMPESWDIKVAIACLNQQLVHLEATRGLVRNIGLDRSGVHGSFRGILRDWIVHNWNVEKEMSPDLAWLDQVELNKEYLQRLQLFVSESRNISLRLMIRRAIDIIRGI
jgi:hypothetical protein